MRMCHTSSITTAMVVGSATAKAKVCSSRRTTHRSHVCCPLPLVYRIIRLAVVDEGASACSCTAALRP
jgi:hypothetical protein